LYGSVQSSILLHHSTDVALDVGLLMVKIWLELCTSYSSSCHHHLSHPASLKSRMETLCYWLTQVSLENGR